MAHHTSWLTKADSALFSQFLDSASKTLCPSLIDPLADGIGDTEGATGMLDYAVHRPSGFAAFKWVETQADAWVRWELFFASPANAEPRIGLRAAHSHQSLPSPPPWLTPFLLDTPKSHADARMPGFLELVALLSSHGRISTTSAATHDRLLEQSHELNYLRQLSDDLSGELRQASVKLRDITASRAATTIHFEQPTSAPAAETSRDLSELRAWSLAHEDRIVILPRALQGAKKSLYEHPETVYAALELLAGPYRDLRRGLLEYPDFVAQLAAEELQLEGSVAPSVAGEQGDAYFVSWKGRRRFMDLHLRKGGGRDERYCLRVYFFWDEQLQKVVVGWLPSHLSNSLS